MPRAHRDTDKRNCGARTVAQSRKVFVNNLLFSIHGDPNTHGGGGLIASVPNVYVNGIRVIVLNDNANPDKICPIPPHCNPKSTSASPNVYAGK
jgi:uncharacterized Zn-binding protein involved in type VI secretion